MISFRHEPDPGHDPGVALARLEADAGLIEAIVQTDRMISALTAAKLQLIDVAHDIQVPPLSHALAEREFRAEIATALRISERAADSLIDEAGVLVHHLPRRTTPSPTGGSRRGRRASSSTSWRPSTRASAATSNAAPSTRPTSRRRPSPAP